MHFPANISSEDLRKLPLSSFQGNIHLVETEKDLHRAVRILKRERVLGFDTETRPSFKKGMNNTVSLLQLSTPLHCFLVRIAKTGLPEELCNILANREILKIGAAIRDDVLDLQKVREFKSAGFIDLQKYVEAFGIEDKALAKLSGIVLGCRISKSQQTSNWDATELTMAQQLYAATDAWICLQIYQRIQRTGRIE